MTFAGFIEKTAGEYSQGDYEIVSSIRRVEITFRDVNADVLTVVNALRYMAKAGTLSGEIDVTSFRAGDLEDYCRFSFRAGETWMARPILWSDTPDARSSRLTPCRKRRERAVDSRSVLRVSAASKARAAVIHGCDSNSIRTATVNLPLTRLTD